MTPEGAVGLARRGELYPGVILHGASAERRREVALELARTLLCAAAPEARPCGVCAHCRRIEWPEGGAEEAFHPDFQVLARDLKSSTSVDATKAFLKTAQVSPFEARGQVFVIASAESLTGEAANALLKTLEEPYVTAPRHFLLLAPSRLDLLPTLRSRSLAIYLGGEARPDPGEVESLAAEAAACLAAWAESGSAVWLLALAGALEAAGDWGEARSGEPWARAARALVAARERPEVPPRLSRPLLALAEELLRAPAWRLRSIAPGRILEGLVAKHLAAESVGR